MLRNFLSARLGGLYHPFLHRLRHKSEYAPLKPIIKKSLATMRRLRVRLPNVVGGSSVTGRTAIQIHVFYTDLLNEFYAHLKGISVPYDLYVSTDTEEKRKEIESFFCINTLSAGKICVKVFENRGRDVYPFLAQLHDVINDYEYVAHFHSKKTLHSDKGGYWRQSLLNTLLGDGDKFDSIISFFERNKEYGLIIPKIPSKIRYRYAKAKSDPWNDANARKCLVELGLGNEFNLLDYEFPIGTMFVARTIAVGQVFEHIYELGDFPKEFGQVEHTLQHALEFVWHPVCEKNGYKVAVV